MFIFLEKRWFSQLCAFLEAVELEIYGKAGKFLPLKFPQSLSSQSKVVLTQTLLVLTNALVPAWIEVLLTCAERESVTQGVTVARGTRPTVITQTYVNLLVQSVRH